METKKYTNHTFFWLNLANLFLWVFILSLNLSRKPLDTTDIIILSSAFLLLAIYLIMVIKSGLAWHSYLEISEEGVKMKGCAKRIYNKKKETIDDIFIPWGDVEEINRSIDGPVLVLKTGEKIKLTQQMEVDEATFRSAFDRYIFKQQQKEPVQSQDEIISVISVIDDNDKSII